MKIKLGYAAISPSLDEINHYRTITWTTFSKLGTIEKERKLSEIIHHNLDFLEKMLEYNLKNEIYFYRMSQNIIPLATHPDYSYDYIGPYRDKWQRIGKLIKNNHLRVDMHPDQYCVINSMNPQVVKQSCAILEFCYRICQAMDISSQVVLHVGSSALGKENSLKRFYFQFHQLPKEIQKMIILENDDRTYNVEEVLEVCENLKIPMVLDYHHYLCHHGKEKIKDLLPRIFKTWEKEKLPPKIHFSSPKSRKEKRTHSTYLSLKGFQKMLELLFPFVDELDIMLECKGKDEALFRLSRQLQLVSNYHFLANSVFFINSLEEFN